MGQEPEPKLTVPCGHCQGTGRIDLTGVHWETFCLLARQEREVSGAELARLAGCKGEAMANRLVYLERRGFVRGRRYGRKRLWCVAV